jgi:hypothetical protein
MEKSRLLVTAPRPDDLMASLLEAFDLEVMPPGRAKDSVAITSSLVTAEGVLLSGAAVHS